MLVLKQLDIQSRNKSKIKIWLSNTESSWCEARYGKLGKGLWQNCTFGAASGSQNSGASTKHKNRIYLQTQTSRTALCQRNRNREARCLNFLMHLEFWFEDNIQWVWFEKAASHCKLCRKQSGASHHARCAACWGGGGGVQCHFGHAIKQKNDTKRKICWKRVVSFSSAHIHSVFKKALFYASVGDGQDFSKADDGRSRSRWIPAAAQFSDICPQVQI